MIISSVRPGSRDHLWTREGEGGRLRAAQTECTTGLPFWKSGGWTQGKGCWALRCNRFLPQASFQSTLWALSTRPSALPGTDSPGFGSFGRDWLSFPACPSPSLRVRIRPQSCVAAFPVLPFTLLRFQVLPALGLSPPTPLSVLSRLTLSTPSQLHKSAWVSPRGPQLAFEGHCSSSIPDLQQGQRLASRPQKHSLWPRLPSQQLLA